MRITLPASPFGPGPLTGLVLLACLVIGCGQTGEVEIIMPEPDNREPLVETISLPQEGEYLQNAIYEEVPCPPEVIENPEAENHCLLIMPGPDYEETDAAE